jgi:hypothetical protein
VLVFLSLLGCLASPLTLFAIELAPYDKSGLGVTMYEPALVTSDGIGTHATSPGVPAFGVNVDGVARVFIDNNPDINLGSLCSGSLLSTGRHLLIAAHCLADSSGNIDVIDGVDGNAVTFSLSTGNQSFFFSSTDITIAPGYSGNLTEGNDLAIIEFDQPLPAEIPRYEIWGGAQGSEFGLRSIKVGYGRSGIGSAGASTNPNTKRAGLNEYDADANAVLNALGGGVNPFGGNLPAVGTGIAYDFDSGEQDNNALIYTPINFNSDLGFGDDEVGIAGGDSGGPTFIYDSVDNRFEIAGVHSYFFGFNGLPDAAPGTNSSWGEVMVDTRVANHLDFINSQLIPEPASLLLALAAVAAIGARRSAGQSTQI